MPLLQFDRKYEKRVLSFFPFCNTEAMNALLEETSVSFPHYRIIMIMDYAGWHTTKKLKLPENIYIYIIIAALLARIKFNRTYLGLYL